MTTEQEDGDCEEKFGDDLIALGMQDGYHFEILRTTLFTKLEFRVNARCRVFVGREHPAFDNPRLNDEIDIGHLVEACEIERDKYGYRVGQWIEIRCYMSPVQRTIKETGLLIDSLEVMRLRHEEHLARAARRLMQKGDSQC